MMKSFHIVTIYNLYIAGNLLQLLFASLHVQRSNDAKTQQQIALLVGLITV